MLLRSRGEGGRAGLQAGRVGRGGDVGTAVAAGNGEKPGGRYQPQLLLEALNRIGKKWPELR